MTKFISRVNIVIQMPLSWRGSRERAEALSRPSDESTSESGDDRLLSASVFFFFFMLLMCKFSAMLAGNRHRHLHNALYNAPFCSAQAELLFPKAGKGTRLQAEKQFKVSGKKKNDYKRFLVNVAKSC